MPAQAPMAAQVAWPLEDYPSLKADTDQELRILANRLTLKLIEQQDDKVRYQPQISYCCSIGNVTQAVQDAVIDHDINLVLMGLWHTTSINRLLAGSTSHEMIEKTNLPLMLMPGASL